MNVVSDIQAVTNKGSDSQSNWKCVIRKLNIVNVRSKYQSDYEKKIRATANKRSES